MAPRVCRECGVSISARVTQAQHEFVAGVGRLQFSKARDVDDQTGSTTRRLSIGQRELTAALIFAAPSAAPARQARPKSPRAS